MQKKIDKKIRLLCTIGICVMFIAVSFSITIGTPITAQSNNTTQKKDSTPLKSLAVFKLFNWNFWSNPPHIFSRNLGNVGIGTMNPLAKLDVFGNIAINGKEVIDASGNWVGSIPGTSLWGVNGADIYYVNGSVGIGTKSPVSKFQVGDGAVLFNGTSGGTPVSGAGTRFMWIPAKAAFRAGYIDGTQWNDANIGLYSVAMGYSTTASGWASTAMGAVTTASGDWATAMGDNTNASGTASTAMGDWTAASGWASTAMGASTTASGDWATAMGDNTNASGTGSTAMGDWTAASGDWTTAMGHSTTANGVASTAMGGHTTASGNYATAMGASTTASGLASTAMGGSTTANGDWATAMGANTIASGNFATAMGQSITVNGGNSFGIGLNYQYPPWVVNNDCVMAIMGGQVGIGTVAPTSTLQVEGDVKISGKYKYNTSNTYYMNIPAAAFNGVTQGSEISADDDYTNDGYMIIPYDSWILLRCPVYLPHGAKVTELLIFGFDMEDDYAMVLEVSLYRRQILTVEPQQMAFAGLNTGTSPNVQQAGTTSIIYATVDNQYYQYFTQVFIYVGADALTLIGFLGCRIAYTMDTIAP